MSVTPFIVPYELEVDNRIVFRERFGLADN